MELAKLGMLAALALAAGSAQAQGAPPFSPTNPGSASQLVNIVPSIDEDDGSHSIEITPVSGGGLQQRSQSSVYAKHGRLWTIPGSVAWVIFPGSGNEQTSAPLPNDADFRPFLVSEDPITVPSATAPFLFAGSHFFDANCPASTCGYLAGGLESEAESSFNVVNGTLNAQARASTPNYGRRWFNDSPFVDSSTTTSSSPARRPRFETGSS